MIDRKDDLNALVWPAMRYALGRKTFVVENVCRALINNKDRIRNDIKKRISEEIRNELKHNLDMDNEMKYWLKVLNAFE